MKNEILSPALDRTAELIATQRDAKLAGDLAVRMALERAARCE